MTRAIDVIRCEISKYRELAAFLASEYINMGFPMYVTPTNIPIKNLSPVKGLRVPGFRVSKSKYWNPNLNLNNLNVLRLLFRVFRV